MGAASALEENDGIYLGSLDSKPAQQDSRRLLATSSAPVYAPAADPGGARPRIGHLLFEREGTLMAQPFDERKLELAGDAVPVAEDVAVPRPSQFLGVRYRSLSVLVRRIRDAANHPAHVVRSGGETARRALETLGRTAAPSHFRRMEPALRPTASTPRLRVPAALQAATRTSG